MFCLDSVGEKVKKRKERGMEIELLTEKPSFVVFITLRFGEIF